MNPQSPYQSANLSEDSFLINASDESFCTNSCKNFLQKYNDVLNAMLTGAGASVAGGAAMMLIIANVLNGVEGCDTSGLGGLALNLPLAVGGGLLSLGGIVRSGWVAKQKVDVDPHDEDDLVFTKCQNPDAEHTAPSVGSVEGYSPQAIIGINLVVALLSLLGGAGGATLVAPTDLAGSGCDVESIKFGSQLVFGVLGGGVGIVAIVIGLVVLTNWLSEKGSHRFFAEQN